MIFWILFAFVYIFVTVLSIGSWLHYLAVNCCV
uniref:Uncharacterized protein n=1 Tax=Anguilla anguilla TaxID=7936 RepID=A0A0E9RN33_ANGAN